MARISQSKLGKSPFKRIMGHNPSILDCWVALENQFLNHPTIDPELIEQVRRVSAQKLQCRY